MATYKQQTEQKLNNLQWFEQEGKAGTETRSQELERIITEVTEWVNTNIPDGRNKSIAITALEDAEMRARRGLYKDGK